MTRKEPTLKAKVGFALPSLRRHLVFRSAYIIQRQASWFDRMVEESHNSEEGQISFPPKEPFH